MLSDFSLILFSFLFPKCWISLRGSKNFKGTLIHSFQGATRQIGWEPLRTSFLWTLHCTTLRPKHFYLFFTHDTRHINASKRINPCDSNDPMAFSFLFFSFYLLHHPHGKLLFSGFSPTADCWTVSQLNATYINQLLATNVLKSFHVKTICHR